MGRKRASESQSPARRRKGVGGASTQRATTRVAPACDVTPPVVNVRKKELQRLGFRDLAHWLEASPRHVYVGRDMTFFVGAAAKRSEWANPFPVKRHGLRRSLELYEAHLQELLQDEAVRARFEALRGASLGCWCHPEPCHAEVMQRHLDKRVE